MVCNSSTAFSEMLMFRFLVKIMASVLMKCQLIPLTSIRKEISDRLQSKLIQRLAHT